MAWSDADIVWSSDNGDQRTRRPPPLPRPQRAPGGRPKVRRETAGRRGKAVTTVADLPLDEAALRELAKALKRRCGVGGAVKDGVIELQGDHRDTVILVLRARGFDPVAAGG